EALTGDQGPVEAMREAFERRRNRIIQLFEEMESVRCLNPKGAFYVFPDFGSYGLSCTTLAELILKKTGVTSVPGDAFGRAYNHSLRFSYATSLEVIEKGLGLLSEFLPSLK
ncbi:MAG: aminotransferase class I/II-fold pyridoxal phosphate-dependent enzyme, partial [Candidatus Thorarchaeota archaeon]